MDLCTPSRTAIRDSNVLLMVLLGCFLSDVFLVGWFAFKQEEITVELYGSFSKRRDDETMRTNRRLMDRASYDDLVQSKLVLLGTTCHSGGWTEVEEGVE